MVFLPVLTPTCSSANVLSLGFKLVQDIFQHDFARMAGEADCSVSSSRADDFDSSLLMDLHIFGII